MGFSSQIANIEYECYSSHIVNYKEILMHVISRKPFNDAIKKYPNDAKALLDTYNTLKKNEFKTPEQLKQIFSSLDNFKYVDKWYVIDIGGNNLRLIAFIEFRDQRMYIKHIFTHADYDKFCKKYS